MTEPEVVSGGQQRTDVGDFRVCAEFNKWTEDEKRSWLKWSLKDRARQ